ncbi:MAG: Serum paraoxonase/arylesterase 2 [Trizodia sp. TS-e1964]|nr:MAG: Serum paraoxonase/arylesterase 2 [Trizodia sp. TS-e1964]
MHCDGWKRSMETYFRLSTSSLSYYSDSAGWKVITSSLQGAGSITGPKTANSKRLYVAGITGGVILVYDQAVIAGDLSSSEAQAAEGDLILKQSISLDFIPSGLTLDLPYGTELWISGFPEPLGLLEYLGEGILGPAGHAKTAAIKGGVASLVATLNSKQLGSGFFGGSQENDESGKGEANGGYTSNPTVEEVLVDEHGTLVNGSYSLIVDRLSDRADRMLYVSGFDGNGQFDHFQSIPALDNIYLTFDFSLGILRCNEPLI